MDPINTVSQVPPVLPVPPVPPLEPAGQPVQTPPLPIEVPPPANKNSLLFKFALFALLFSFVAAGIYIVWVKVIPKMGQKACTMEAKVCPDGTSVGRVGANCEFSPCPVFSPTPTATSDPTANWKTYTNKEFGYSLKYPVGPKYIQETCGPEFGNIFMLDIEEDGSYPHPSKLCVPKGSYSSFELQPAKGRFAENEYPKNIPGREVASEPITIDNVEGRKYTIIRTEDAPIPEKTYEVFVEHNSYRYHFIFIAFKHEYLFDQILSTFKFLEATLSASPQ